MRAQGNEKGDRSSTIGEARADRVVEGRHEKGAGVVGNNDQHLLSCDIDLFQRLT